MAQAYASDFSQIPWALTNNPEIRAAVLVLVAREPVAGKATEGGDRLEKFRRILRDVVEGRATVDEAAREVEVRLPARESLHAGNSRVFTSDWADRLVWVQVSRFYNQAVLESLVARGVREVFVPHSPYEDASSPCTARLAGQAHDAQELLRRLVESYGRGQWTKEPKIPDHPHCSHVVAPAE